MKNKTYEVMIIEDSADDLELYKRIISKILDCHICNFSLADKALEAMKDKKYDIILLDYNLPSMSGIDFLQNLHHMKLEVFGPIIALTGQGNENIAVEFMRLGVTDYIQKSKISQDSLTRAVYNALEIFEKKLVEREKQQELYFFSQTVAHDLKSPLGRISSYARMLAKKKQEDCSKYINNIIEDSQYMLEFIESLLAYAEYGRSNLDKCVVDLNQVAKKSIENLEVEINKKKAQINVSQLENISGNKISLIQLFQNLISNSIKYCKNIPIIDISCEIKNNAAVVSFLDNGIGIPEDKIKDIFKPFTRIPNSLESQGVGLGLALCDTIAKQHQATIEVQPQNKSGTKFIITFPRVSNKFFDYHAAHSPHPELDGKIATSNQ